MVSKVLEIGWNNISKRAHAKLRNSDDKLRVGSLNGEGWILHVPTNSFSDLEPSLLAALELAKAKGCTWLVIGFVGKETSELSIYESDEDLDDEDFIGNRS